MRASLSAGLQIDAKQNIEFTYDPRWLATNGSFPLSMTLPLESRTYEGAALLTWLANLLPEGPNLIGVTRVLGISTSDALAILKAIGGYRWRLFNRASEHQR